MHTETKVYSSLQAPTERVICQLLAGQIDRHLPEAENKVWHAHPVWFLDVNPIVGYSKLKDCARLLFWSADEDVPFGLHPIRVISCDVSAPFSWAEVHRQGAESILFAIENPEEAPASG